MDGLGATGLVKGCLLVFGLVIDYFFLFFVLNVFLGWRGLIVWCILLISTLIILWGIEKIFER